MSSSAESLAEIHSIYANDFLYGRFISISASKLAEKSAKKKRKEEKKGLLQQFAAKKWGCLGNSSKEIQLCLSQLGDQSSTAAKRTHPCSVYVFNNRLMWVECPTEMHIERARKERARKSVRVKSVHVKSVRVRACA